MNTGLKIFCTFVVLGILNIIYDATNITKSTETKIRGRLTDASSAVLSRHRFGVPSRDLPSLFNFKPFNMLGTKGQRNGSKVETACNNGVLPTPLIEAAKLIGQAKNLILNYHEANPQMHDCIWDDVFKIENGLIDSACRISNIASIYFIEKNFFEVGKEATV